MLELLKVIVQPVVLERDENGAILGERAAEPTSLYTEDQVAEFFETLRTKVAEHVDTDGSE